MAVAGGAVRRVRPEFPSPGSAQHIGAGSGRWHSHTPLAPPTGLVVYGVDVQHHHTRRKAAMRCAELALGGAGVVGVTGYGRLSGMAGGEGGARSGLGRGKGAQCASKHRGTDTAAHLVNNITHFDLRCPQAPRFRRRSSSNSEPAPRPARDIKPQTTPVRIWDVGNQAPEHRRLRVRCRSTEQWHAH